MSFIVNIWLYGGQFSQYWTSDVGSVVREFSLLHWPLWPHGRIHQVSGDQCHATSCPPPHHTRAQTHARTACHTDKAHPACMKPLTASRGLTKDELYSC